MHALLLLAQEAESALVGEVRDTGSGLRLAGRCRINPGSRGGLQAKKRLLLVRTSGFAVIRCFAFSPQTSNDEQTSKSLMYV